MSRQLSEGEFGVAQLFALMEGESFIGERKFQRAVIHAFNSRLSEFPPHYSYLDAISWAVRQNWIKVDGARITIALSAAAGVEADPPTFALAA